MIKYGKLIKNQADLLHFEGILKLPQGALKGAVAKELRQNGYDTQIQSGFVYASGDVPVLLVAHLDTVHQQAVKHICYSRDGKLVMSPEGIGGDDRAGVYMVLQIVKKHRCHVLFCEDEEIGGIGAQKFSASGICPEVNYIVEVDRRGADDAVFYDCDNREFTDFICKFGFHENFGSFSDISVIAPSLGIAAVNISAGYYNEHCRHEYINLEHTEANIERISRMVSTPTEHFEYVERMSFGRYSQMDFDSLDYWGFDWHSRRSGITKALMPLPDSAYLMIDGHLVESSSTYYLDASGIVYDYLPDINAAVESENTTAYSQSGLSLRFDRKKTEQVKVIPFEIALEMLG